MSVTIMTSVWQSAPYSEGTLLTLLALADWANDEGVCWPKLETLADKARLSVSGVKYAMRKLLDDKAVAVLQETTGPGKSRTYQIGVQYLNPSKKRGAVNNEKGCSKPSRNKEEPSLEPLKPIGENFQIDKSKPNPECPKCGGTGKYLHNRTAAYPGIALKCQYCWSEESVA